jgi:hypothetical protein
MYTFLTGVLMFGAFWASAGISALEKRSYEKDVKLSKCIMEQIELHEENRENYFPRMGQELLHGFIMECVNERYSRKAPPVFRKVKQKNNKVLKGN